MQRVLRSLGISVCALSFLLAAPAALAAGRLERLGRVPSALMSEVSGLFDASQYRAVRVQPLTGEDGKVDRLLVHLHGKTHHRVDFALVTLDEAGHVAGVERDHVLTAEELDRQPGFAPELARCPDPTVQFISFCPNDDQLELAVTDEVAQAAIAAGLKTVELTKTEATRQAYLNYMACPNLRGNFYDGDANPSAMTTNDGLITATDIQKALTGAWKYKVTNIWLACEAYNDPMLTTVQSTAQSRKYAAGINDLEVGPSDHAAACAMEDAILGKPLTAAFQACVQKLDTPADHWGFGGDGEDIFWP